MASSTTLLAQGLCLILLLLLAYHPNDCEAGYGAEKLYRHQNFGKYHYSHVPPSSSFPSSAGYSPRPHAVKPFSSTGTTLAVEGIVVCQNCKYANTSSLKDATPLHDATVRLACRDMRFKTFVYETTTTNKAGYFLFLVDKFEFARHKGVRGCRVRLVSSPDAACAKATNINFGKIGSPLTTRQKVYGSEILYSVGPFAFASSSSSCYKH